jgi:DNA-binding NtrC family response regulator/Tfp pilus assembly protein PilF
VVPDDRKRIEDLEERLVSGTETGTSARLQDLETLADLYFQSDAYEPALETLASILDRARSAGLSPARHAALTLKQASILRRQGRFSEAFDRLRPHLGAAARALPRILQVALSTESTTLLCHLARYDEALDEGRHAVALAEAEGDRAAVARAVGQVGFVHLRRGDMLLARESYEDALALFRRLGDEPNVAWARNNLGIVCKNLCEWDVARVHFTEAIAIHRKRGQQALLGNRLQNLGVLLVKSGAWERAHGVLDEARQAFLAVGDRWGTAINALARGWLARLEGRHADAESLLRQALDASLAEGFVREEALAREFLGDLAFDRGQLDQAAEAYRAALALGERQAPAGDLVSEVLRRIGEVETARGRYDAAEAAIERAVHVCTLLDDRYETAVLQRVRGQLEAARGRTEAATHSLRAAVNLLGEMGERFERGKSLTALARITTDRADARKLLFRASACFAEVGAERELSAVESELGQFEAAPSARSARGAASVGVAAGALAGDRLKGRKILSPVLIGPSKAMARVLDLVSRAAGTDLSVILVGETGTGKELVARAIHRQSRRDDRPFIAVNCGALRVELALSQLFGHRKGAFTGAHADGTGFVEAAHTGTLFLDEIGELPHDVQVTLLRFLESGEYTRLGETQARRADVRILGATHVDLRRAVAAGTFRADLFYRLHEIEIQLPSLRERSEDILPLARHFLRAYGGDLAPDFDDASTGVLLSHSWPGNVRELENCVKRALALLPEGETTISGDLLGGFLERGGEFQLGPSPLAVQAKAHAAESERRALADALDASQGNKSRAAEQLGVSRKTLYARLRRLGMEVE